jgi:hypothetical protein
MPALLDRITSTFAARYPIERELARGGMATAYHCSRNRQCRQPSALE